MHEIQHPNNRQFKKRQLRKQRRKNMRKDPRTKG